RQPRFDYAAAAERRRAAAERRAQFASQWGAWPKMGSYAWAIAGNRSATGYPWLGGFPQTGIQTPSIMHFAENRTDEGIAAIGMEFAGAPLILIGHGDHVAWTTTTALLRTVETYFEPLIDENADALRSLSEGAPSPLSPRTEVFRGNPDVRLTMWRTHERNGNGGSRPVLDFLGDTRGTANGGTATTLQAAGAFDSGFAGGTIAIVSGTAAGEIRHIAAVLGDDAVEVEAAWTTVPTDSSEFVAVRAGQRIIAVATESPLWLEETTSVLGFGLFQRAGDLAGIKAGARVMPSTHNFVAADNRPFNELGVESGNGNIGYWTSGFSRLRTDGSDVRLPIDGSGPNPFIVASGVVAEASATTLRAAAAVFNGRDLGAQPVNFRYDNPGEQGREHIVAITSGAGYKQTRRIAANTGNALTLEYPWGVTPIAGDTFEVYAVVGMPEAINPSEGYMANWNNKSATADDGNNFGRLFRHIFILERLAADTAWDRDKQRRLNADVAGLDGKGDLGRFLLPRLRQAVDAVGDGGNAALSTVLAQLEAQQAAPDHGRFFNDPVADTTTAGEVAFMNRLINRLAEQIYGDEFAGALPVPTGSRALSLVQHAIDSAAGDLPNGYTQQFGGDYFDGVPWQVAVRDALASLAGEGIPPDSPRPQSRYAHPLSALLPTLVFEPTPQGNRGTYEQIVDVGPLVRGEFIFPLGQSGLIEGGLGGVTAIDPNFDSLQPIWRDWRFVPMLPLARDLAGGGSRDSDGDGVDDAFERWYYGDLSRSGTADADADGLALVDEARLGVDPTAADTDGDGLRDGFDNDARDRLAAPHCVADCDNDRAITIDELLRMVSITLGAPVSLCASADANGDGAIDVTELVRAVNAALLGCTV
ncbi:MAG: penicillin acylase family protein, partial [Candidatus Binatia bacterium]